MNLTVIIMIDHAIKINSMTNIFICLIQCWVHGTLVNKCPKLLSASPVEYNHALLVHDPDGCNPHLTISLSLDGVTSLAEYEDKAILKYHLMSESPPMDPITSLFSLQEDGMVNYRGCLITKLSMDTHHPDMAVSSVVSASYMSVDITDNKTFATVLEHHVKVDMTTAVQTACLTTTQQTLSVDSDMLACYWSIPLDKDVQTVECTTQHGVRIIANPTLVLRFCTNTCMLKYHCLRHTVLTDTMFASTLSWHENKCAQIFSSNFGWLHAYPMKMKGVVHDALSLMFQHKGGPPLMVMDRSKEMTLGKFCQKCQDAGYEEKTTEPLSWN